MGIKATLPFTDFAVNPASGTFFLVAASASCDHFTQSPKTSLLLLVAHTERMLALLDQARLLMAVLASADRALFLLLLFARTKGDHVALAATAPMIGACGGLFGVVRGSIDVLRKARICCAIVGDDVALACDS